MPLARMRPALRAAGASPLARQLGRRRRPVEPRARLRRRRNGSPRAHGSSGQALTAGEPEPARRAPRRARGSARGTRRTCRRSSTREGRCSVMETTRRADPRRGLGSLGEDAVARWYEQRGYSVAARNWRVREGELDLVLQRGRTVVFCEVKTRRGDAFGTPFEAVTVM